LFPGAKPEQYVERLDQKLRQTSQGTFGAKPPSTLPREKLQFLEIGVLGLDCHACSLAAYEAVAKLPGVEQATASFRDGLVTAWIDPAQTSREKLEEALKQKGAELKPDKE
jgi:copper chaperone CopZ